MIIKHIFFGLLSLNVSMFFLFLCQNTDSSLRTKLFVCLSHSSVPHTAKLFDVHFISVFFCNKWKIVTYHTQTDKHSIIIIKYQIKTVWNLNDVYHLMCVISVPEVLLPQ